jgi:hypothetical protein
MKLRENVVEQQLEIKGFNFEEVFNKTLSEVKKSYFDSPELFVEQFIKNAPQIRELGKTNKWESSEEVFKEVDKRIRDKKLMVVSEKQLAQLVITVVSEEFVEPPQRMKQRKKAAPKKIKPKDIVYQIEESLIGKEVVVDASTVIPVEEFEDYSKKKTEHPHSFKWEDNQVTVMFEEITEDASAEDEDDEENETEDDEE